LVPNGDQLDDRLFSARDDDFFALAGFFDQPG
jgi:hypothetical protein